MADKTEDFSLSIARELTITLDTAEQMDVIEMATTVDFEHNDGEYETTCFTAGTLESLKEYAQGCIEDSDGDEFVERVFKSILSKHGEFDTFRFYYSE